MFRRNSTRVNSLPHHVDEPVSDAGQHGPSPTIVSLLAIALSLSTVSGLAAAADDVDRAGPFSSRGRASGNLVSVSGYLGAIERQRRRFSRAHVDVLFRKLGGDFNTELMSIEKPSLNLTRTDAVTQSSFTYEDLMRHVDFSLRDDETGVYRPLKPSARKYVEKWLLQRASCRLHPAWTDLGALFWPRWVRRGSCGEDDPDTRRPHRRRHGRRRPAASCSWPPGMRCVPEASETIKLLRWQCSTAPRRRWANNDRKTDDGSGARKSSRRRRRGRRLGHVQDTTTKYSDGSKAGSDWQWRCRWKKVPYAITVACFCSC